MNQQDGLQQMNKKARNTFLLTQRRSANLKQFRLLEIETDGKQK
jgi:hypothetical protein